MRPYFSFEYGFKKFSIGITIEEIEKNDLVGWGYDVAPTLTYMQVNIFFIHFTIGNLSI